MTVTRAEAAFRTWDRRRLAATGTAAIWHQSADMDRAVHRAALALLTPDTMHNGHEFYPAFDNLRGWCADTGDFCGNCGERVRPTVEDVAIALARWCETRP